MTIRHKREGLKDAIIVDIDGTLAEISQRRKYVENKPKNWDKFFQNMEKDGIHEEVVNTVRHYYLFKYEILLLTGREEKFREVTENWLEEKGIGYSKLFMRDTKDFRADDVIKEEIFKKHIEPTYNVFLCIDDRNRVVNMWRRLGLVCFQVADGNF